MEPGDFNLSYRRKKLYKRKKQRQILFLAAITFMILIPIVSSMKSESNFIATIQKIDDNPSEKFIICIDPGHGDWDVGTTGVSGSLEKDIVLSISLKLGELLNSEEDIKVIYTRSTDSLPWLKTSNDSLKERIKISNLANADLFISLHCNSNYDDPDSKGVETWYNPDSESSKSFASYLQDQLSSLTYSTDRGLKFYDNKEDALAVLEKTNATSALVEFGFISNFQDEYYLNSSPGQSACAEALYKGIIEYKNSLSR